MKKTKPTLRGDMLCTDALRNTNFIDAAPIAPIPANDSSSLDFPPFTHHSFVKSKTAHNKMLMRRRKRSQHPLRDLRLKRGFTLEELAELTQLSPSYLSRLESGSRRLNADILQRIATILGCHPGDLLPIETTSFKYSSAWTGEPEKESLSLAHPVYIKDLPLHTLVPDESCAAAFKLMVDGNISCVTRPPRLYGIAGSLAFRVTMPCCGNRYSPHDYIFADPASPLSQDCHILVLTNQGQAFIGQFEGWQPTEGSQGVDALVMRVREEQTNPIQTRSLAFKKTDIKNVYRLVGTIEAD